MDDYRQGFEQALKDNPYDMDTRRIYADWLDENNFPDEAVEQRRRATYEWVEADRWLREFCKENNPSQDDEEWNYVRVITYDRLIELGKQALEDIEIYDSHPYLQLYCGNDEYMCDALRANKETFWKMWSTVTGIPLPDQVDLLEDTVFSCSC